MKRIRALIIASLVVAAPTYAQDTQKELSKGKSGDMSITSTDAGMYGGTTNEKAMRLYTEAIGHHKSGELEKAKMAYEKAIKADPKFVEAYDNLGQVHRQLGELDKAIKNYKKSIELYPQGQMARQNLAVVYSLQGDNASAQEQYEAMIAQDPEDAEGYFGLANSLMLQQELGTALKNAEKALDIYKKTNSDHLGDGHYLVGMIHYYRDDMEAARTELQAAKDLGTKIHPQIESEVFGSSGNSDSFDMTMEKPEDYERLAPYVVKAFEWLYKTPMGVEPEQRQTLSAFVLQWITGSPTVTVEITEKLVPYMEQGECLILFLAGYSKHAIETEKPDKVASTYYATQHVIDFYERNKDQLGKNKEIEKLAKMDKENKLKQYIKSNTPG